MGWSGSEKEECDTSTPLKSRSRNALRIAYGYDVHVRRNESKSQFVILHSGHSEAEVLQGG